MPDGMTLTDNVRYTYSAQLFRSLTLSIQILASSFKIIAYLIIWHVVYYKYGQITSWKF